MRIAVMAAGAVGGYFGARLAAAGHDVTFIARGAHRDAIRRDGLKIESALGDLHLKDVNVTDDPKQVGPVDVVLFAVKLWDTETAGEQTHALVGSNTRVITLQNGVDSVERLAPILGDDATIGGATYVVTTIARPGVIRHTGTIAKVHCGRLDGRPDAVLAGYVEQMKAASIDITLTDHMRVDLWKKFVLLSGTSGITASTRQPLGVIRDDADSWTVGQNTLIDYRWSGGNMDDTRKYATELVALAPDVLFAPGSSAVGPLRQATRTVPIVFVLVVDPVGSGFISSLAHPGGNITGFTSYDYGIGAKWLEVLKEIAPSVTRAAIIRDPAIATGLGMWAAIQSVSPSAAIEVSPVNMTDAGEIERAVAAFARSPNGGLIVTGSALTILHRDLIVALAARHKLPAVYWDRTFVAGRGLVSYGPDTVDQYRQAAGYVDRILKGEKPADLPVQAPTRYEL